MKVRFTMSADKKILFLFDQEAKKLGLSRSGFFSFLIVSLFNQEKEKEKEKEK